MKIVDTFSNWKDRVIHKVVNWLLRFAKPISFSAAAWAIGSYSIMVYEPLPNGQPDFTKPVPHLWSGEHNLVVDTGRQQVLKAVLGIDDPGTGVAKTFPYIGVGEDSTPPSDPPSSGDLARTTLIDEIITGNLTERLELKNMDGDAFEDTDIVADHPGGSSYYWKVVGQVTYAAGDLIGFDFGEFGIFSLQTFSPSGVMYNRFANPSPFTKSASLAVVVQLTLRA